MREVRRAAIQAQKNCKETLPRARRLTKEMMLYWKKYDKVEKEHRKRAEKEALEQRKLDEEMREVGGAEIVFFGHLAHFLLKYLHRHTFWKHEKNIAALLPLPQAKRQQRKLNFLITQTELYAHFMSGKASIGGPEGDTAQEEILRKLEDTAAQRQIDIGGGVMVNMGQEDYGMNGSVGFILLLERSQRLKLNTESVATNRPVIIIFLTSSASFLSVKYISCFFFLLTMLSSRISVQ